MNKITISLKPYHEQFLRHQFNSPKGAIHIDRNHQIGQFIYALVEYSAKPIKQDNCRNPVNLEIPNVGRIKKGFAFISAASTDRISAFVESYFLICFRQYIFSCRVYKIQFNKAIDMFIETFNLGDSINFECLKKNDYRFRTKIQDSILEIVPLSQSN